MKRQYASKKALAVQEGKLDVLRSLPLPTRTQAQAVVNTALHNTYARVASRRLGKRSRKNPSTDPQPAGQQSGTTTTSDGLTSTSTVTPAAVPTPTPAPQSPEKTIPTEASPAAKQTTTSTTGSADGWGDDEADESTKQHFATLLSNLRTQLDDMEERHQREVQQQVQEATDTLNDSVQYCIEAVEVLSNDVSEIKSMIQGLTQTVQHIRDGTTSIQPSQTFLAPTECTQEENKQLHQQLQQQIQKNQQLEQSHHALSVTLQQHVAQLTQTHEQQRIQMQKQFVTVLKEAGIDPAPFFQPQQQQGDAIMDDSDSGSAPKGADLQ